MKITKGQLKRIIREEHALVYGAKKPTRVKGRKTTSRRKTRKQYLSEARRELIIEQRSIAFANQLHEAGFGSMLKGLAKGISGIAGGAAEAAWGGMTKAGNAIASAADKAATASMGAMTDIAGAIGDKADEMGKTISKNITDEVVQKIQELTKDAMSRLQKEYPDKEEEELKAFVMAVIQNGRAEAEKKIADGAK